MHFSKCIDQKIDSPLKKLSIREGFTKKIWNFPDLVGGWVWKSPFSRFKKIKNMFSKCIKMPKYSFKRNLFFAIWGGVSDWFWPTHHPPTSHALRLPHHALCWPHQASCQPHSTFCRPHRALCQLQETRKKHLVNIKFKFFF